jgi:hypothetical protein
MTHKVLLAGLGDLGRRLAISLAAFPAVGELVVAGRRPDDERAWAALVEDCAVVRVRYQELDLARQGAVERLLRRERPAVVLHSASLLSPWHLHESTRPAAESLLAAGFAAQLPAQLPLLLTVMDAARAVDFRGVVVNCSYPDVTHPILARLGLAPLVGLGNVGMIRQRVLALLRRRARSPGDLPLVRVLAYHSQVGPVLRSEPPADPRRRAKVFLGEAGEPADDLPYAGTPVLFGREINALTCASAVPLLLALLPGGPSLRTSAPGPLGLLGGYPIRVTGGQATLDLPPAWPPGKAEAFQRQAARQDGIAQIEADGTVVFTPAARKALRQVDPALAEPLAPRQAHRRFLQLAAHL